MSIVKQTFWFTATWLFTRINPHLCICMLLAVSIPLTSLLIYQDSLTHIHAFLLIQGACFGAIESGEDADSGIKDQLTL